jgi:hypothetical protein
MGMLLVVRCLLLVKTVTIDEPVTSNITHNSLNNKILQQWTYNLYRIKFMKSEDIE